ncbi:hypothetical protein L596_008222 [Steinernema carpocapsae]|uniref:mRNA (guanine-N(7))-methyltransferase n=1 Tax=Steinernema carpocapsae TaxID=34508 RepID=A0A4U5PBX1_STECR|nr:hypothetical protein L596_008222 [Steinernema carpocapsae]
MNQYDPSSDSDSSESEEDDGNSLPILVQNAGGAVSKKGEECGGARSSKKRRFLFVALRLTCVCNKLLLSKGSDCFHPRFLFESFQYSCFPVHLDFGAFFVLHSYFTVISIPGVYYDVSGCGKSLQRRPGKRTRREDAEQNLLSAQLQQLDEEHADQYVLTLFNFRDFKVVGEVQPLKAGKLDTMICSSGLLQDEFLEKLRQEGCHRPRVLDLCCGKGGDLLKWKQGNISSIVMTDVADVSLQQCESRYREMKDRGRNDRQELFSAQFLHADASKERLLPKLEGAHFDISSCQFALHYSFASEAQARQMLQNATESIRLGGYFIGTLPDADVMYHCIKENNGKFLNDVCSLEYDDKTVDFQTHIPPLFGAKFHFTLDKVVNCPEFLVHFELLVEMMKELGFELALRKRFSDAIPFFLKDHGSGRALFGRMQALEPYPPEGDVTLMGPEAEYSDGKAEFEERERENKWEGHHRTLGTLSQSEWQVASMYLVFAFQRVSE